MHPDPQPTFRALSDPTRRNILQILAGSDLTIAQISDRFDVTRTAIAKHLTILEQGDLITVTTRGRERINSLKTDGFAPAADWFAIFDIFWDQRLASLKSTIEQELN